MPAVTVEVTPAPAFPHPAVGEHFTATVKWADVPNSNQGTPVVLAAATLQTRDALNLPWVNIQIFNSIDTLPPFQTAGGDWTCDKFTAPDVPPSGHRSVEARVIGHITYVDINGNGQVLEAFEEFTINAVG